MFARAIGESGAAFSCSGLTFPPLAKAQEQDEAFIVRVWGASETIAQLRSVSSDAILHATSTLHDVPLFAPDVDGEFLPQSVPGNLRGG